MNQDIKGFWQRFQSGVDVTVAVRGHAPEKSLGVREGFLRYLHEVLDRDPPLIVRAVQVDGRPELPMTDRETLTTARDLVSAARAEHPEALFVVACEEGLSEAGCGDSAIRHPVIRHLVKSWAVVSVQPPDRPDATPLESWGTSSGLQVPDVVLGAPGDKGAPPTTFPSTRRGGGMVASITRGTESRRTNAAQATFLALCSLFYGRLIG